MNNKKVIAGIAGVSILATGAQLAKPVLPLTQTGVVSHAEGREVGNTTVTARLNYEEGSGYNYTRRDTWSVNVNVGERVREGDKITFQNSNLDPKSLNDQEIRLSDGTVVGKIKVSPNNAYFTVGGQKYRYVDLNDENLNNQSSALYTTNINGRLNPGQEALTPQTELLYDYEVVFNKKAEEYDHFEFKFGLTNSPTSIVSSNNTVTNTAKITKGGTELAHASFSKNGDELENKTKSIDPTNAYVNNTNSGLDKGSLGGIIKTDSAHPLKKGDRITFESKSDSGFKFKLDDKYRVGSIISEGHGRNNNRGTAKFNSHGALIVQQNYFRLKVVESSPDRIVLELMNDSYSEDIGLLFPVLITDTSGYDRDSNRINNIKLYSKIKSSDPQTSDDKTLDLSINVRGVDVSGSGVLIQYKTTQWINEETGSSIKPSTVGEQSEPAGTIEDYTFVRTTTSNNGASVNHYFRYTPRPKVFTYYRDENSVDLKDKVGGIEAANTIERFPGYHYLRTETDEKGNKILVYHKIETEYIGHDDPNHSVLFTKVEGEQEKREFPGYKFERTEIRDNEDRIHHYNKLYTIFKDETGKEIKRVPGILNDRDFGDLPGYKLIRVDTDNNGNKIPVYHKIVTKFVGHDGNSTSTIKTVEGLVDKENIADYKFDRTETESNGDRIHHYNKLYTIFKDENGAVINRVPGVGAEPGEIPGYKLIRVDTDNYGNKIPVYHKIMTKFVGHDGTQTTEIKSVEGLVDKETIADYKFDRTEMAENGDRIHHYNKLYTIFKDENGTVIKRVPGVGAEPGEVPGYKLIRVDTDNDGNKIPVYHKIMTKFVGHDGDQESVIKTVEGLVEKETIKDWKFNRSETLDNGDQVHHYDKVYTIYRDENGNEIKRVPGSNPDERFGDIPGYKLIRVDTDKDGNKVPVYHKIMTKFIGHDGDKLITIKTVDSEVDKEEIKGYKYLRSETAENGDRIHHYNKTYTISTDENGAEIGRKEGVDGELGDLPGYKLIRVDTDENGNKIPVYHKIVTKFVYKVGDKEIVIKTKDGLVDKEDIKGYKFEKTEVDEKLGDRIHYYTPVYTIYRDQNGNEITRVQGVDEDPMNINGYKLIIVEKDDKGNKIPIYHKIVTRFVTFEGDKEIVLQTKDGIVDKEDIKDYRYVKSMDDKELGDKIHVYEPLFTILRDENGNEISRTKGIIKPGEIPGYKLIRVDTDKDGNQIPVYHKLITKFIATDNGEDELLKVVESVVAKEDFEGYKFEKTEIDKETGDTIHRYSVIYTILKDDKGNVIKMVKGKVAPDEIPGYKLIRIDVDENGNQIPVYHKIVTKFIAKYPDKEIVLKTLDGEQPKEEIKGYQFDKTEKDETLGDSIHYYKPLSEDDGEWTIIKDEFGNIIKTIKGKVSRDDLANLMDGYKLIRVDVDANGNLIPIYHKIVTRFVVEKDGKLVTFKTLDGTKPKEDFNDYEFIKTETDKELGDTIHHYKMKPKTADKKKSVETGASAGKFIAPILGLVALVGAISYKVFGKKRIK